MRDSLLAAGAVRHFQIDGKLVGIEAYGSGHINDTSCVVFQQDGTTARFILQRINTHIFPHPEMLMENIQRVTAHLAGQVSGDPAGGRRVLRLVPTLGGKSFYRDEERGCWRAYRFVEGARTYNTAGTPEQAFQAAKAFGQFQKMLVDLPGPRLHDILPDFHDTPKRFNAFERVVAEDSAGRAGFAKAEIEFAFAYKSIAGALLDAGLPERVTHNDTKLNNVLFDDETGEGICVVDLDTVMPGLALYDFGDMVRTTTSAADEDEADLSQVHMQIAMFEALVRGYLGAAGCFLTEAEKKSLVVAGKVITYEQGIRFLTDYVAGDTYYKVHREGQNLDRCRTQFKLIESIERQEEQMHRLVDELADEQSG